MKPDDLQAFDAADALRDLETIRHYVSLAFDSGDLHEIQRALETATRALASLTDTSTH